MTQRKAKMTIRPFTRELRSQGFEFCWRDRGGGTTVTQFAKRQGDRELHVQLWTDGLYRVTHGTYSKINGHDCLHKCTPPTEFKTVDGMRQAIEHEWHRPSGKIPSLQGGSSA